MATEEPAQTIVPKIASKKVKIAGAQALTDLGFSIRQIAKILRVDVNTVMVYQDKDLDEEFRRFSDTIKKVYLEQDFELTQMAVKGIKEKIGDARFYELVGLLKVTRELQQPKNAEIQQQFNSFVLPNGATERFIK